MAISHKQEGICKGEAEGVHTGSVLSLSSAGLQPSVTNYHIQRLFSRLAPLPTKCYTGKNSPARKKKKTQQDMSFSHCCLHSVVVFWPLLFRLQMRGGVFFVSSFQGFLLESCSC